MIEKKLYIFVEMSKRKNENELEEHEKPQLKGRDSKVVRLIRNSCPFITNFGHVWSDQTRVTHLQNVQCVIRTSVVLILDDMIV